MTVVQFPNRPKRAIVVREVAPGLWEGIWRYRGEILLKTEVGAQWLVLDALTHTWERRGLPIVIAAELPKCRERAA